MEEEEINTEVILEPGDIVRIVNINHMDDGTIKEKELFVKAKKKVYKVIETERGIAKVREVFSKNELPWVGMYRFEVLFKGTTVTPTEFQGACIPGPEDY